MDGEFFEVWTQNEDGWTDYHEETEETDDFEIAMDWLNASDCIGGEIRYHGKAVAYKDRDEPVQFENGWNKYGKIQGVA